MVTRSVKKSPVTFPLCLTSFWGELL